MIRPAFLLVVCVLCLAAGKTSASCRITPTRSTTNGENRNYYDEIGNYRGCCRMFYPILYSSAKCSYISLAKYQSFEPFIQEWDEGRDYSRIEIMPEFSYLSFEHSQVPTIFVSLFSNFTNVTHLYMNATQVEQIQQGGFNGLDKLKVLQLANNQLTEISRGILNHLSRLIVLNMSHNHIDLIESNAFMGLLNLEELILNNNNVKILHPNTFPYLKFIEVIDLSYNMIIDIPQNAFEKMSEYRDYPVTNGATLDLSHNYIKSLNSSYIPIALSMLDLYNNSLNEFVCLNSSNLQYLSLASNNISNITAVHDTLVYLDLSANKIYELNSNLLTNSILLETVDLSYNYLHKLHDDFFTTLASLLSLSLSNNNLVHIPIGCFHGLSSLQFLNISGNKISEFEYGTFSGLQKLITLDICNNTLSYLYESLYLDHNLITSFDPYDITEHLRELQRISLNYNPWNCKSLLNIFSTLRSKDVTVLEGRKEKSANINGIACTNRNIKTFGSATSQGISNNDNKQVNDLQTFNSLFMDSQLYQFFKNFSYAHFEEDKFLDNFQKAFTEILDQYKNDISNTTVIEQLNDTVSKFIVEFQSLPDKLANYSVHERDQLREDMFRYFNTDFKNSTFHKYFNKEMDSPIFTQISTLKQFLNSDFKNSSFYKFFENKNLSRYNSEHSKDDLPKFEKLVNVDERVVTNISGLQSSVNTLLVIIIVLLCCFLTLFLIKSFNRPLKKFVKGKGGELPTDSHATLELI